MLKGRRIIFVLGNLELGGAERQALLLARYLAEREEAHVEVWGFTKSGPAAEICQQHGIASRVVPYPLHGHSVEAIDNIGRLLLDAKPDILLPYTFTPNVICGLVWKATGARSCVWNQRDEGQLPLSSSQALAARQTPFFISNSTAGARFLNKLGIDPAKVSVIPNGIAPAAPESDRRAWRARLAVDEQCLVACMVANLHANKDHVTLLRAWRDFVSGFNAHGRHAVLVLAGRHDGAYESLASLATELKIDDSVRFTGPVSDVSGLLSAVDLGVLSSRSEGCPNAVLESMAAGLPVVGTDIEGIREVVGPAGAPFLAAVEDHAALAAVLTTLANDHQLRTEIGAHNRERVRNSYDSERMCEETAALLARIE
ncbi:MAG TPA: glycosyltransferase [Pyrinomonadaceae bacterium]|nr:glycosyltransferase [Pyrinomonadaceae bacterium]